MPWYATRFSRRSIRSVELDGTSTRIVGQVLDVFPALVRFFREHDSDVPDREAGAMKAIVFDRYGGPDVLEPTELDPPVPSPGEVRIRVRA